MTKIPWLQVSIPKIEPFHLGHESPFLKIYIFYFISTIDIQNLKVIVKYTRLIFHLIMFDFVNFKCFIQTTYLIKSYKNL